MSNKQHKRKIVNYINRPSMEEKIQVINLWEYSNYTCYVMHFQVIRTQGLKQEVPVREG
jgi:hypothetical protein